MKPRPIVVAKLGENSENFTKEMDSELKEKLAALRSYVEDTAGIGPAQRDQILGSVNELEEKFRESHHSLMESLEESVLKLEAAHPKATGLLQQISDALARMGI